MSVSERGQRVWLYPSFSSNTPMHLENTALEREGLWGTLGSAPPPALVPNHSGFEFRATEVPMPLHS